MEGVEAVRQLDDRHLDWVASIGGVRRESDAERFKDFLEGRRSETFTRRGNVDPPVSA